MEHLYFDKLVRNDDIWDAHTVGKNLFFRAPGRTGFFEVYFDFCIKVANYPLDDETRHFFINEAQVALVMYSERVSPITEHIVERIRKKKGKLQQIKKKHFGHSDLMDYNKEAIKSFKQALDLFNSDKVGFQEDESGLIDLAARYLFVFDLRKLYAETRIYYNHIYEQIFNSLSDEGKFLLTERALNLSIGDVRQ